MVIENKWRIGLSAATLKWFKNLHIKMPVEWKYQGFSTRRPQSTGGEAVHGLKNLALSWENLSIRELRLLVGYNTSARAATPPLIYLTINRADGTAGGPDWIDISGRPGIPEYQVTGAGLVIRSVTWQVNDITIVNDPAVF